MRVQFCNWFCEAVCKDEVSSFLTYFTDETCFYLNSLVNPQNTNYLLADNPRIIHAVLLHGVKIGV